MPIVKVSGGWKWGKGEGVHKTRQGAVDEAQAAYASGYTKRDAKRKVASKKRQPPKKKKSKRSKSSLRRLA